LWLAISERCISLVRSDTVSTGATSKSHISTAYPHTRMCIKRKRVVCPTHPSPRNAQMWTSLAVIHDKTSHSRPVYITRRLRAQGTLCIFHDIPSLFPKMLDRLKPYLPLPPPDARSCRVQVSTSCACPLVVLTVYSHPSNRLPESSIAPYLTQLQARVGAEGIPIGSYLVLRRGVYVSLIGVDCDSKWRGNVRERSYVKWKGCGR